MDSNAIYSVICLNHDSKYLSRSEKVSILLNPQTCHLLKGQSSLQLAETSRVLDAGRGLVGLGNGASGLDLSLDRGVGVVELAGVAQGVVAGKNVAIGLLDRSRNAIEVVALSKDVGAGGDLELVVRGRTEVVVDGVEDGLAGDLGATARDVVDVVALEGDLVVGAGEVHTPVLVAVAGGAPLGLAIDLRVGDGNLSRGVLAEDEVLAANLGGLELFGQQVLQLYFVVDIL